VKSKAVGAGLAAWSRHQEWTEAAQPARATVSVCSTSAGDRMATGALRFAFDRWLVIPSFREQRDSDVRFLTKPITWEPPTQSRVVTAALDLTHRREAVDRRPAAPRRSRLPKDRIAARGHRSRGGSRLTGGGDAAAPPTTLDKTKATE